MAFVDGGEPVSSETEGTGAGLLAFLDWAGKRGEMSPATAKNLAYAAGKVLAVEPDPAAVDVRNLDPEDLFGRFETLNRMKYTTESMGAYRSRFFRAVSMYNAWLGKRPDWKSAGGRPPTKAVALRPASNSKARPKGRPKGSSAAESLGQESLSPADPPAVPSAVAMVPYDLPLRPGLRVRLVLPEMLTQADAKRIAAFVDSLAFDQGDPNPEGG
jgi:hypothetical protein